jgi:hypothetical protein
MRTPEIAGDEDARDRPEFCSCGCERDEDEGVRVREAADFGEGAAVAGQGGGGGMGLGRGLGRRAAEEEDLVFFFCIRARGSVRLWECQGDLAHEGVLFRDMHVSKINVGDFIII